MPSTGCLTCRKLFILLLIASLISTFWSFLMIHWIRKADDIGVYHKAILFHDLPDSHDSRYKVWSNIFQRSVREGERTDVTLISQCSVDHMHHIIDLLVNWRGPVSVAVFVTGDEYGTFMKSLLHIHKCNRDLSNQLMIHAVFPLSHPPFQKFVLVAVDDVNEISCTNIKKKSNQRNYHYKVPYPNNLLRNVALKSVHTSHVLVIDIDMIPKAHVRKEFGNSDLILKKNFAFVLPVFEMKQFTSSPSTKSELLDLYDAEKMRPFYYNVCFKCHESTDYERWKRDAGDNIFNGATYRVNWSAPYEPFYITLKENVYYDERFEQYGFNRIGQLCDLHMRGIQLHVLLNAFLIHDGFKEKSTFHSTKDEENKRNKVLYNEYKKELEDKYGYTNRHC